MDLSELYLPPDASGIGWLLDAGNPEVGRLAAAALARRPGDACDPDAVADDLEVFASLLRERHFGIATGIADPTSALARVHQVSARVRKERPRAWGEALGGLLDPVRVALRDHHVQMTGAPPTTLRADEPRFTPVPGEPAVTVEWYDDLCWIRLARLHGSDADLAGLEGWIDDAPRHFSAGRIIVDLRGNTGGDDSFVHRWAIQGAPGGRLVPEWAREWRTGGTPANAWNNAAIGASLEGTGRPGAVAASGYRPSTDDTLDLVTPEPLVPDRGPHAWDGRMLVLTDPGTSSSGESSAWMLKHLFDARLVGAPSRGMIEYGNVAPYLLPATGTLVVLPTKHNDHHLPVELRGFPVDVAMVPTSLAVEDLAHLW